MQRLIIFIILLCQVFSYELRNVKFAAVIYRHGDRMPVDCYPTDPYRNESLWPEPFGQLSIVGKKQHFRLGRFLRERYASLLSKYYVPREIYVQSTDVDRTLMSAEANLAGLFPPIGKEVWEEQIPWQPIPVHTTPEYRDEVIAMKRECPLYNTELDKYMASAPYLNKLKKYKNLMEYLSSHTGMEVRDFVDVMLIYSCLNIESLYNFTLPEWTKLAYPEPLGEAAGISFSTSAATPRMARLIAGPLVQQIVRKMSEVVRGESPLRLMMYSGHDFTVGTVLTALGMFDNVCPQYTATIFFELIQETNTTGASEWYVQVLYRNTVELVAPVVLAVPGCGAICPFHQFLAIYENLITVDWERECAVERLFVTFNFRVALLAAACAALALWSTRRRGVAQATKKNQLTTIPRYMHPTGKLEFPGTPDGKEEFSVTPICKQKFPGTHTGNKELPGTPAAKKEFLGTPNGKQELGTPASTPVGKLWLPPTPRTPAKCHWFRRKV